MFIDELYNKIKQINVLDTNIFYKLYSALRHRRNDWWFDGKSWSKKPVRSNLFLVDLNKLKKKSKTSAPCSSSGA